MEPLKNAALTSAGAHETASTRFVAANNIRYAYRRFGRASGPPLLLLNYFAATLDDWDPRVTNGLAAEHDVILFDNAGVGASTGQTPATIAAMMKHCLDFCRALNLEKFDVLGFSLGGMIAQQLASEHPNLVRRIILLGTGPRGWEGLTFTDLSLDELADPAALLMASFITQARRARRPAEPMSSG